MSYGAWGATAPLVAQPGSWATEPFANPPAPKLPPLTMAVRLRRTDLIPGVWGPFAHSPNNPGSMWAMNPAPWSASWGDPGCGSPNLGAGSTDIEYYSKLAARTLAEYDAAADPELAAAKLEVQIKTWKGYIKSYPVLKPVLQPQIEKAEAKLSAYKAKTARSAELYSDTRQIGTLSKVAIGSGVVVALALTGLLVVKTVGEAKSQKRSNGKRRRRRK